ncbi:hypothetical protein, variant [Verruconis gallopava]|uniref:CRAL-TRIO domain-containing protein n=1 Tax=Verruconis gallopava TaxID=253628 RepID=A0A0D1ZZG9_9PEZI|nr:uncharacterized protein PV09_08877 [Verruconis gallopava]XP_016209319.1 hypothetical protein, variant [Verruconis gallopava]KIV99448.1 hypothetical protein PV09_08877 [Verruconis gallopava]KIV99449.1 hypothetical protein, variant [Verruconis gallopava]
MAAATIPEPLPLTEDTALAEKTAALSVQDVSVAEGSEASSIKDPLPLTEQPVASVSAPSMDELAPKGPIAKPIPYPLPTCKPEPAAELTAEHQKKYDELLAIVKAWTEIPVTSAKGAKSEPLDDTDRLWLTRDCLLRYLRATKWNVPQAADRLRSTLTWQREFGVRSTIDADYVSPENETGKQVIMGFDVHGRPCLYLNPGKQNTDFKEHGERQTKHLVFMLQRVIDILPPGQESVALLINYKDTSNSKNPPMSQSRQVLSILQTHYPERLGRALISDLPWYVTTFYKLISPFIDPVTKSKMKFNEPLTQHVPAEQLLKAYGGKVDFEYDHKVYWPALNEICDARRRDYAARWEKAGKQIGEHEAYLRGGDAKSLNGEHTGTSYPAGFAASA